MRSRVWRRGSRSPLALGLATLLCVLLGIVGCGVTSVANPAANTLDIAVQVFDHEDAQHAPSATTHIVINLLQTPKGSLFSENINGADAQTLVCDGNTQLHLDSNFLGSNGYFADVPAQTDHYTCTYFWNNGAQSAAIVIPVLLGSPPSIEEPTNGATVAVPSSTDPGVAISYNNSGEASAQVMATALDFNKRSAASDPSPDRGAVTIPATQFPANFGIGWGTITLTRSVTLTRSASCPDTTTSCLDITARAQNRAFHSVKLTAFEQSAVTPVRWL